MINGFSYIFFKCMISKWFYTSKIGNTFKFQTLSGILRLLLQGCTIMLMLVPGKGKKTIFQILNTLKTTTVCHDLM